VLEADRAHYEDQFRPRVQGLIVLEKVLRDMPLDFCMVNSSLGSILGVVGFVAYAAAHAFMDAFSVRQSRMGCVPWTAINWENWATWKTGASAATDDGLLMSAAEGAQAFHRLLGREIVPQVAVSVGDLQARMTRWLGPPVLEPGDSSQSAVARHPRPLPTPLVAPRNDVERRLAAIWEDLLGIDHVGVEDSFFELGGDSVVSLQMVSRASQAGLRLTARQVFEQQTIAALAATAVPSRPDGDGALVTGPMPLTPIQRWFFEQELPRPEHFNLAMLLEVNRPLEVLVLEKVARALLAHHDALRLRFRRADGTWEQRCEAPGADEVVTRVDLSAVPADGIAREVEREADRRQRGFDIVDGPTFGVTYFDLGPGRAGRLLLAAHHLVTDAVSWRILLDDFRSACEQVLAGRSIMLPPKTASFKEWAEHLRRRAQSPEIGAEAEYWLSRPWPKVAPIPVDRPGTNLEASARSVVKVLDARGARFLLQDLPRRHDLQVDEFLVAALVRTLGRWTGAPALLLGLEDGRDAGGNWTSCTVGWFAASPILIEHDRASDARTLLVP
jgi:hypothetical protein